MEAFKEMHGGHSSLARADASGDRRDEDNGPSRREGARDVEQDTEERSNTRGVLENPARCPRLARARSGSAWGVCSSGGSAVARRRMPVRGGVGR